MCTRVNKAPNFPVDWRIAKVENTKLINKQTHMDYTTSSGLD